MIEDRRRISPPPRAAIRVIMWEVNRKVASPILQEKMGGQKAAAHFFDEVFWQHDESSLKEKPKMKNINEEQIKVIAKLWQDDLNKMIAAQNHDQYDKPKSRFSNSPFRNLKFGDRDK